MPKLINKTRFTKFANDLWDKIKNRYDETFKDARITAKTDAEKKITFTKVNNQIKEISLADYARLSDKNNFEKDVTSNIGMTDITLKYGTLNGNENNNRTSGHRGITSKSFVDGYIDHITVLADETQNVGQPSTWNVWAVTKGATRDADRVFKKIDVTATIRNQTINGVEEKVVDLPIGEAFTNETYFLVRCAGRRYKVVNIKAENRTTDVVNLSEAPGNTNNSQIPWNTNADNNIAVMFLVGRESIKSLSEKINKANSDSSLYVKHSDCTVQGGNGNAGKVAKLDQAGKLDATMLPSIAINEYIEITAFTNDVLRSKTYENGDVVVVTSGTDSGTRYLCINKDGNNLANLTDAFIKLNDKDGVVTNVNGVTGAVTLKIEATTDKLQLKVNDEMKSEVDVISDAEIDAIINGLN